MKATNSGTLGATGWAVGVALVLAMTVGMGTAPRTLAQGVKSVPAGVGKEDRRPRPGFPLKLTFARQSGAYLAGVAVTVFDAGGKKVFQGRAAGPWLYLDLPPGSYRIVAALGPGRVTEAETTLGGGRQKSVYLTWK